jgi:hypothetical protein
MPRGPFPFANRFFKIFREFEVMDYAQLKQAYDEQQELINMKEKECQGYRHVILVLEQDVTNLRRLLLLANAKNHQITTIPVTVPPLDQPMREKNIVFPMEAPNPSLLVSITTPIQAPISQEVIEIFSPDDHTSERQINKSIISLHSSDDDDEIQATNHKSSRGTKQLDSSDVLLLKNLQNCKFLRLDEYKLTGQVLKQAYETMNLVGAVDFAIPSGYTSKNLRKDDYKIILGEIFEKCFTDSSVFKPQLQNLPKTWSMPITPNVTGKRKTRSQREIRVKGHSRDESHV